MLYVNGPSSLISYIQLIQYEHSYWGCWKVVGFSAPNLEPVRLCDPKLLGYVVRLLGMGKGKGRRWTLHTDKGHFRQRFHSKLLFYAWVTKTDEAILGNVSTLNCGFTPLVHLFYLFAYFLFVFAINAYKLFYNSMYNKFM